MTASGFHIVFVCSRLDLPGGTERASVNLANLFSERGHRVTMLVVDSTAESFYALHPAVALVQEDLHFGITEKGNKLSRKLDLYLHVRRLKKKFSELRPDVVIGTEYSLSIVSWLAARGLNFQLLAWEHHHIHWLKKNRFWNLLFRKIYPKLDAVVCQNSTEKKLYGEMGCASIVIPYVLPDQEHRRAALEKKQLLTIGWLIRRKGVDLIPSIAERLAPRYPDWHWKIIGRGEEREALLQQIREKNLEGFISLQEPASQDLGQEYLDTSIYVMTSRFECLPMVLLEASSYGLPLVAFDCPTGPADIIHDGKDGFIVPLEDLKAMANAISGLIDDAEKRKQMGTVAAESSKRYQPDTVYAQWQFLFEKLQQKR